MNLYLNGEFIPIEQERVSVEDRGFQLGDGVYEVVRAYNGKPFRMKQHLARLDRSLKFIEVPPVVGLEDVCRRLLAGMGDATVYLQVTRGAAPRVHTYPADLRPTVLAYARPSRRDPAGKTYALLSMADDRWAHCDVKAITLLANCMGREKAKRAGCDEGLYVREDGTVTEGCATNSFMVRGGALITHPATNRILHGITREATIQLAAELSIPVLEQTYTLREAMAADEFFMTGTGIQVMPVATIDGKPIATGPIVPRLQTAFDELVRREIQSQVQSS